MLSGQCRMCVKTTKNCHHKICIFSNIKHSLSHFQRQTHSRTYMFVYIEKSRNMHCIVFIHFYSASHSLSFQKRSRPQQLTLCRSLHAKALQAIAGKGPYMAARAGFEPGRTASSQPMRHHVTMHM